MVSGLSVVMISAGFYPAVGGAERQALELSTALRARGARIAVLTRRLPGQIAREVVRDIPVVRLWCMGSGLLNALTFLVSLLIELIRRRDEYEVIHVHLAASPAVAAILAGRLLKKRVVIKLGGPRGIGELAESAKTMSGRIKLFFLSRMKPQFVAITRALTQEASQYLGAMPIVIIPNGVDAQHYHPIELQEKQVCRGQLGWPAGTGFLFTGRLWPQKNLPFFLENWLDEVDAAEPAFVAFIGEGPEESVLRAIVKRRDAAQRVFFHSQRADLATVYAAADIFVLPSIAEGLSNAMLEAMAAGLPVLGSRISGTIETVEDGRCGLLFSLNDGQDLKRQLRKFLNDPGLAVRMGQTARQIVCARYAMSMVAELYEALYRK